MLSALGCKGGDISHLLISSPPSQRAQRIPEEGFLDASPLGKGASPSAPFLAWSISHLHPICPPMQVWVSIPSAETHRHPSELQGSSSHQHGAASRRRAITPGSQAPSKKSSHQPGRVPAPSSSLPELPSHRQHSCLLSCPGRSEQVGQKAPGSSAGSICSSIPLQREVLS